jgi:alcohol dehydrogenase
MTGHAEALVLEEPRELVRRTLPIPEIGDDDAVLRVEACGLCGTDHEQFTGLLRGPGPFVPGHESVGVIEAIGPAAAERWHVAAGDRVAVEVFLSCRECDACRAGEYRRCVRHGLRDMYGFVAVDRAPGLWGGYATHQYLAPDSLVLPVPDSLDPVLATLFNPLGAGFRWAVEVPRLQPGAVVAVLGPGVRGLSALAAAKHAGAGFVMVTGAGAHDEERLATAERMGADLTVDVTSADPVRELHRATGGLADVVVDVTAKAPAAFAQAIALARAGGTVVVAGTRGTAETPGFDPDLVVYKELTIHGALGVDTTAYASALELLAADPEPWAALPRRRSGLDGVADLLRTMAGETADAPPVHGVVVPNP